LQQVTESEVLVLVLVLVGLVLVLAWPVLGNITGEVQYHPLSKIIVLSAFARWSLR